MAFNLIFLATFFAPLVIFGFIWLGVNRVEQRLADGLTAMQQSLDRLPSENVEAPN